MSKCKRCHDPVAAYHPQWDGLCHKCRAEPDNTTDSTNADAQRTTPGGVTESEFLTVKIHKSRLNLSWMSIVATPARSSLPPIEVAATDGDLQTIPAVQPSNESKSGPAASSLPPDFGKLIDEYGAAVSGTVPSDGSARAALKAAISTLGQEKCDCGSAREVAALSERGEPKRVALRFNDGVCVLYEVEVTPEGGEIWHGKGEVEFHDSPSPIPGPLSEERLQEVIRQAMWAHHNAVNDGDVNELDKDDDVAVWVARAISSALGSAEEMRERAALVADGYVAAALVRMRETQFQERDLADAERATASLVAADIRALPLHPQQETHA